MIVMVLRSTWPPVAALIARLGTYIAVAIQPEPPQDEDHRRQRAHADVEARFEVLVDRVEVEAVIERKRHVRDPRVERKPRRDADAPARAPYLIVADGCIR